MAVVTNLLDRPRRYVLQPWRSPKTAAWLAPFGRLARGLGPDGADLPLTERGAAVELPAWGFAVLEARTAE